MSIDSFVSRLVNDVKVSVREDIVSSIEKECMAKTDSIQTQIITLKNIKSHWTVPYPPNVSCASNPLICKPLNMVCSNDTQKCIPVCNITSTQNQNVQVNKACQNEMSSFVQTSRTQNINSGDAIKVSASVERLKNSVVNGVDKFFKNQPGNNSATIRAVTEVFIKLISSTTVSETCASTITSVQNQNLIIEGDIWCDPGSSINITQTADLDNFVNCTFSKAKDLLLADPQVNSTYNNIKNSECVCDTKYLGPCDPSTNTRSIKNTILKPAIGNGKCVCPVETTTEPCSVVPKKNVECQFSEWSNWSECLDGKIYRYRKPIINCPDSNQPLEEVKNCPTFFNNVIDIIKSKIVLLILLALVILFVLFL